ncbi:MAG: DUF4392 domain-containing protein [Bacillota bacterium]|nr:DUF4392 domain-containing protein [Bacillota bacterium]
MIEKFVNLAEKIEEIITENLEFRGMAGIKLQNQLINTAVELNNSKVIVIVTGFYIHKAGIGETDGPLGALSMANTLSRLDKEVVILTDEYTSKFIEIGIDLLGIDVNLYVVTVESAKMACDGILSKHKPDHVIAIERPGKSASGKYHSMSGEDLTDYIPDLDYMFEIAKINGIRTSAIGDGGNEIGMGKIKDYIISRVPLGEKIASVTETDNLIIAGVSNWGGHGVSAMISALNDKDVMYDENVEYKLLDAMVSAGAVDGCTKKAERSVDGFSLDINMDIIKRLRELVK